MSHGGDFPVPFDHLLPTTSYAAGICYVVGCFPRERSYLKYSFSYPT